MNRLAKIAVAALLTISVAGAAQGSSYTEWLGSVEGAADQLMSHQNNDGGFGWFGGASAVNTQGATGRGLIRAYEATGKVKYLNAANDVAGLLNTWVTDDSSHRLYNKDVEFLYELAAAGGDDYTAMAATNAAHYINEKKAANTANTGAKGVYDAYKAMNWPGAAWTPDGHVANDEMNGLKFWMVGEWAHVGQLLGDSVIYTEGTSDYTGNDFASEMATLIANESWDPSATDKYSSAIMLGYAGRLEGAFFGGADTSEALEDLLGTYNGSVQSWAYRTYILGLLGEKGAATYGSEVLMSVQNSDGGWYNSDGDYNEEVNGEALMALAMNPVPEPLTMLAVGSAVAGLGGYIRRRRRA